MHNICFDKAIKIQNMKKEYLIGDRRKYGLMLMETVRLEEKLPYREIYRVKWTSLTNYEGLNIQVFPMVRTDGEFAGFTPITKVEYNEIITTLRNVSDELKPLLEVKKRIDKKICETHQVVWDKFENG